MDEKKYLIRLLFAVSSRFDDGFAVIFEKPEGTVGTQYVWYNSETIENVRFADSGDSYIVYVAPEPKPKGNFLSRLLTEDDADPNGYVLKEIVIRRDFQTRAL